MLDAALRLFAEQGYLNTPIEQLCQEANVSTRSFYEIFEGREDCHRELFRELSEALEAEMLAELEALPADEAGATELLLGAWVHSLTSDKARALVLLGPNRAITPEIETQRRENREWAATFVNALWQQLGVKENNHAIAIGLIGGMFDIISFWLIDGDLEDAESVDALERHLTRFYGAVRRGVA